jgi:hypothetical protein
MQITIGDIGAIAGLAINKYDILLNLTVSRVLIYRPNLSAHRFRVPHIISIGYLVFAILAASYLYFWMSKENQRRDQLQLSKQDSEESLPSTDKKGYSLGDRSLRYRFVV